MVTCEQAFRRRGSGCAAPKMENSNRPTIVFWSDTEMKLPQID